MILKINSSFKGIGVTRRGMFTSLCGLLLSITTAPGTRKGIYRTEATGTASGPTAKSDSVSDIVTFLKMRKERL